MRESVEINRYVVLLQEYFANSTKSISQIEILTLNDFFQKLKPNFQKALFNACLRECEFFPKMCKVEKLHKDIVRTFNANMHLDKMLPANKEFCNECKNTGFVIYYSDRITRIKQSEYYENFDKYSGFLDKYMCCCYCNNGKNKFHEGLQPYVFEIPKIENKNENEEETED